MLVVAGAVTGIIWLILRIQPNPDPGNAQYLLSTIPQVIATVFVLSVTVLQVLKGSEVGRVSRLLRSKDFIINAIVTLIGISAPLIVLYFGVFCEWTAFCLAWGIGNLFVITWFIGRYTPELVKAVSLSALREEALDKLKKRKPVAVVDIIRKMRRTAKEQMSLHPQNTIDACGVIRDIILQYPYNSEVWEESVKSLIEIHKEAKQLGRDQLAKRIMHGYLNIAGQNATVSPGTGRAHQIYQAYLQKSRRGRR